MKKDLLIITTMVLSLLFSSCKKDDKNDTSTSTATPSNQLFTSFTFDGVATNITGTSNQFYSNGTGTASSTSSAFINATTLATDIDFTLSMPQDTILGSDLQSLIGQNIPFMDCLGCVTNMSLSYEKGGVTYKAVDINNPFPANYLKFTAVTFYKNENIWGQSLNEYYVTGEFNAKLSNGGNIKDATNGTFKIVISEVKN